MKINKNDIKKLDDLRKNTLKGIAFDKGLHLLREKLWEIAIKNNTTGNVIFGEYMEYLSTKEKHR